MPDPAADRVIAPYLVELLATWVAGSMRGIAMDPASWPELDVADAVALDAYLTFGPTARLPDDAAAFDVMVRVIRAVQGPGPELTAVQTPRIQ